MDPEVFFRLWIMVMSLISGFCARRARHLHTLFSKGTKVNESPQQAALFKSVERMKQIAAAHAPAFIELARGVNGATVIPGRPGIAVVSRLLGLVFVADAQCRVLKNLLVEAAVTTADDFDKLLTVEVEASAVALADAINDGTAGIRVPFEFQPVAEPANAGEGAS